MPSQQLQTPPEPTQLAAFSVRLTTATGHAFMLCGNRDPAQAGAELLRSRRFVSEAYYRDVRDSLDYIAAALLTGKRNTALLRTRPPDC